MGNQLKNAASTNKGDEMVKVEVNLDQWHGPIVKNGEALLPCKQGDVIIVTDKTWEDMQSEMPGSFSFVGKFGKEEIKQMTEERTLEDRLDFKNKMVRRK
jgi:hypothetical protein